MGVKKLRTELGYECSGGSRVLLDMVKACSSESKGKTDMTQSSKYDMALTFVQDPYVSVSGEISDVTHLGVKRLIYQPILVSVLFMWPVTSHLSYFCMQKLTFTLIVILRKKNMSRSFGSDTELSSIPPLSFGFYQTSRRESGMVDCITAGET